MNSDVRTTPATGKIWRDGIWARNMALVQLLGLCPLLAVTTSVVNGLGLGLATLVVVTASNTLVSTCRKLIKPATRIPAYVLIIATLVTCVELGLAAWFPELNQRLGIFVPLIVTNCAIVARAEIFASKQPILASINDGLATGTGFMLVLVAVGALRELIGQGSLFAQLGLLFGGQASDGLNFADGALLLAILPPGAFFALALLIILKNRYGRGDS